MRHPAWISIAFVPLFAASCAAEPEKAPLPEAPAPVVQRAEAKEQKPLDKKVFGGGVTEKTSVALHDIIKEPKKYKDQTVRTEGRVVAVCKSMGCWMEIADDSGHAHIKMAGHSFFVPKESSGHRAAVQGKVIRVEGEGDKDECTKEAEEATGKVAKIQFEATGVEFLD